MPVSLKSSSGSDSVYGEAKMWIFLRECDDKTPKECMERFFNATCTYQLLRLRGCVTPFLCMLEPGSMEGGMGPLHCLYSGGLHKSVIQMLLEEKPENCTIAHSSP